MKNLFFVFLLVLNTLTNAAATTPDTLDYTVVASSGLSLRTAPYIDSERLEVLPYGTQVKTIGDWEEVYSLEKIDTVDARVGYWIETDYNGKKGYLFSGYLKTGPLYVPPTEINNSFRITVPGERCQAINYDPLLNWYGIYIDPETTEAKVKAVDLSVEQITFDEEEEEIAYADIGDFLQVKSQQQDSFLIFFGTPLPIDPEKLAFEKSYFENTEVEHWDTQGKFVYPYERLKVAEEGYDQYYLVGQEQITITESGTSFEKSFTRKYDLYLSDNQNGFYPDEEDIVSVGSELNTEYLSDYQYATYLGPRLVWQGDINQDGFPDMIFYTPYMSECCGGSVSYQLLVSEKVDGKWQLKKVAADEIFSCYGC